ncbi:hypothetical protein AB6A40_007055 [Gnathostoma spinigerum]|uniref:Uncharacterized protein n=1 Tax=Gnathostoma spinigerum TaxID=75299 RepID=A0ABD6EKQ4_9BILA
MIGRGDKAIGTTDFEATDSRFLIQTDSQIEEDRRTTLDFRTKNFRRQEVSPETKELIMGNSATISMSSKTV